VTSPSQILAALPPLPSVRGEGQLFAFSGLDGWTRHADDVVSAMDRAGYDLLLHRSRRRVLVLRSAAALRAVTGDVLLAGSDADPLVLAMRSARVLVGRLDAGASLGLEARDPVPVLPVEDEDGEEIGWISIHEGVDAVALLRRDERFALAVAADPDDAIEDAELALGLDPLELAQRRLEPYRRLPRLEVARDAALLAKCLSVMRVNALAPEGRFDLRWSTPDRVPHRDLWLWDSAFHAIGMRHHDAQAAAEYLTAVYRTQREDGMIPHQSRPNGHSSAITQPPVLLWAAWLIHQGADDEKFLRASAHHGERYLDWDAAHRDANANGLLEWRIADSPTCRSGESGLDNCQRFDQALTMDAVDFSVFWAEDARHLALILRALGREADALRWDQRAAAVRRAIHELLWDDERGLYVDRHLDGRLSSVQSVVGFLPLLLPDCPPERVDRLVATLQDPTRFAAAHPIPAISLDDPDWSTDMWRGSTWINTNYLVIEGLRRHGRTAEARIIRRATLDLIASHAERAGTTFEFYDARGEVLPERCLRKGAVPDPYDCRAKISSIRDYHWTAALAFDLLMAGDQA
jgi:hypothetical protein